MSLRNLITKQTLIYYSYIGQSQTTGAKSFGAATSFTGRIGEGGKRFDTQEATDLVSDAVLISFTELQKNDKISYLGQEYIVAQSKTIRKGNSAKISHYVYQLLSLDDTNVAVDTEEMVTSSGQSMNTFDNLIMVANT